MFRKQPKFDGSVSSFSVRASSSGSSDAGGFRAFNVTQLQVGNPKVVLPLAGAAIQGQLVLGDKLYPGTPSAMTQSGGGLYAGSGVPSNALGSNGDTYIRTDGSAGLGTLVYHKESGAWVALGAGTSFPILAPDGSVTAPSYSFANNPDMGFYRSGAGTMGFAVGGVSGHILDFDASGLRLLGNPSASLLIGTGGGQPWRFQTSNNGDSLDISRAGGLPLRLAANSDGSSARAQFADGAVGAPSISFVNETQSGMYRAGATDFRFAITGQDRYLFGGNGFLPYGYVAPGNPGGGFQSSAKLYGGSGAPNNGQGSDGDFYIRSDGTASGGTTLYHKEAGSWTPAIGGAFAPAYPLRAPDGSAASPSYSWTNNTNDGWYRAGAHDERYATNGADALQVLAGQVAVPTGSLANPGLTFLGNTGDGIYRAAADDYRWAFASAGGYVLRITPTFVTWSFPGITGGIQFGDPGSGYNSVQLTGAAAQYLGGNGNAGAPIFSFNNAMNSGLYLVNSGAGSLGLTVLGTKQIEVGTNYLDFSYGATALGGGAAPTFGTIGGAGPTTAAQNCWIRVKVAGVDTWIPGWQ